MNRYQRALIGGFGVMLAVVVCLYVAYKQPRHWNDFTDQFVQVPGALLVFAIATALVLVAAMYRRDRLQVVNMLVAVLINIVLGELLANVQIPLYLDSVFTIAISVAYGPLAGIAVAMLTQMIWAIFNSVVLIFSLVAIVVALLAGILAKVGGFYSAISAFFAGVGIGFFSSLLAAPVAVLVYSADDLSGTGNLITALLGYGENLVMAVILQCLLIDPIDKAISAVLAFWLLRLAVRRGWLTPKGHRLFGLWAKKVSPKSGEDLANSEPAP
ncbi:hypothetical protein QVA66_05220 [Staphylococcus chromogenes]|nr:hypothetical protein [Staphylococcus chromogenes]